MKLIIITDPKFIPEEAAIINYLFRKGMACLHVRKPESNEAELRALLSAIDCSFLNKTAVHQHHHLAEEFGIKRLHFTVNHRITTSPERFEMLNEKGYILSTSIHNVHEASNLSQWFSYTFFGPVFDSITKTGYKTSLPDNFTLRKEIKKVPVIGLGGIDLTNLHKTKMMNLDGVAVLGALWQNPAQAVENLIALQKEVYS